MTDNFLPFSRPSITEADIRAVDEVLRSGWITTGPKAAELEQRFCEVTGCAHAVALSSATAAMHLLLHALNIGPGDEVVTPSMTWVSTVNLIMARGATPVFVDVERDTLMTTADRVEPLLTPRTRCFNLHSSLLPEYLGRAPINWVLVNGEQEAGVTLHLMTEQADVGDIVAQRLY